MVVDDDRDIREVVGMTLESEGYEVGSCSSAEEGLEWIARHGLPHLALVDIVMPGIDGFEFCRRVQTFSDLPIIMLTGVEDEDTAVHAFEEFAEDYVTKPFQPRVLAARVKRVLRRIGDFSYANGLEMKIDDRLSVDFVNQHALVEGRQVSLTPIETKLLHILIRNARRTVSSSYLLQRVWPHEDIFEDTLRVHVHRLRQKIEPEPSAPTYLKTARGSGYAFHVAE